MSGDHSSDSSDKALNRRLFLSGVASGAVGGGALVWGANRLMNNRMAQAPIGAQRKGGLGLPGPYPGRVVEVHHPGAASKYERNREAVKAMVDRGMKELVGTDDGVEAWKSMFSKGDRVGIKVVPVGRPHSISSPEVVLEIIDSLIKAGVRAKDILVFDRYEQEFRICKYDKILPDGVHWECESVDYDEQQLDIDGQLAGLPRSKRSSGYDRDEFRELAFCAPSHDRQDDRRFRSHLSKIISQKIDKYIGVPVLKDHRSAGVTLSLKNLSHGSVNNVCRSHISNWHLGKQRFEHGMALNQCGTFIPAIVSLPKIREKAVLQVLDGLVATYEGGPGVWNSSFATWNHNSLFFATDPVALDHIGWEIIDKKRAEKGWAPVAKMGLEGVHRIDVKNGLRMPSEQFQMRQPEHIPLAATLGLGTFERHLINHQRVEIV